MIIPAVEADTTETVHSRTAAKGGFMTKRIISLLLALTIVLGTTLALSSCAEFFFTISGSPSDGDGSGGETGGGDQNGGQSGGGQSGDGEGEPPVSFYPGSSDIDFSNVTASTRALLSSVAITSHFKKTVDYGYSDPYYTEYKQYGSGVIYRIDREAGDAYIITNYHVVYHRDSSASDHLSTNIEVYLYGQESHPDTDTRSYPITATFVGGSMTYDIAVLRIEDSEVIRNSIAMPIEAGDSDELCVMDPVIAIGNAEGYGISATEGIVSIDNEELEIQAADGYTTLMMRVMRISASINDGNSGGGLFTPDGKLAGIVVARRIATSTYEETENIAYAIPGNLAINLVDNIIHYCAGSLNSNVFKCTLGFTPRASARGVTVDPETGKVRKVELVAVSSIENGALITGLLEIGDVINSVTVDGVTKEVTRVHHLLNHMITARVGSTVVLSVTRGEETFDVTVVTTNECLKSVK